MTKQRILDFAAEASLVASTKRRGPTRISKVSLLSSEYDEESRQICRCYHGYFWCEGGWYPGIAATVSY